MQRAKNQYAAHGTCKTCKSMQTYAKHAVYANHVTTGNMQNMNGGLC